jgi:O-antigen/teichoic acid export membrane protein
VRVPDNGRSSMLRLLRHRSSLILVDQAVASVSNFAVVLLVGRWLGPAELGLVALVLSIWVIAYGVFRAAVGDPMVVFGEPHGLGEYVAATGVMSVVGIGLLVGTSLILALASRSYAEVLALAVGLPFLLLQDLWRRVAYMRGQPGKAVWNDVAYLAVQGVAIAVLHQAGEFTASGSLICWGLGAAAGAALGVIQFRPNRAGMRAGVDMLMRGRGMSAWLVLDFGVNRWARQAVLFIIAAVAGTTAVGAIQASASLLGFTNILVLGWSSEALAVGAVAARRANDVEVRGLVRRSALFLLLTMALACGLFAVLADKLLPAIYGSGYSAYTRVAAIVALQTFLAAMDLYPVTLLRILQRTRRMFAARAVLSPIGLLVAWPLASLGLRGAAWATVAMAAALTGGAWLGIKAVSSTPGTTAIQRSSESRTAR